MRVLFRLVVCFALVLMAQSIVLAQQIHVDSLPINHIQTIGSHNSYRKPMDKRILGAIRLLIPFMGVCLLNCGSH